jgi:hypothetical protein
MKIFKSIIWELLIILVFACVGSLAHTKFWKIVLGG